MRSSRLATIIAPCSACLAGMMALSPAVAQVVPEPPRRLPDPLGQRVVLEARPRPTPPPDARVDAAWIAGRVARLDDPSFDVREAATFELIAAGVTPEQLAEHARSPDLSPEAAERLAYVAQQWFVGTERAALGVSFGYVRDDARTAVITGTLDGFDAARVLQPGDVITAVNGEPVTYQLLRAQIVSHDPGQSCTLTIVRAGKTITSSVAFGRWSDLTAGRGGFVDESILHRALGIRLLRAGWPVPEPVAATLDAHGWAQAARAAARLHGDAPEPDAEPDSAAVRAVTHLRVGGQGLVQAGDAEREAELDNRRIWRRLSDEALRRERDIMKMQAEQLRNEAARLGLDGPARQRILDAIEDRIRMIDRELARRQP